MSRRVIPEILYRDDGLLVIDKPARVLSVSGRGSAPTIAELLHERKLVPADEPFRPIHRLDRDASGVILFARTIEAQRHLTEQFVRRTVDKRYLALALGRFDGSGLIDLPIAKTGSGNRARVDHEKGRPSRTAYRVLEVFRDYTLVECSPLTGRLHQIRVHLATMGHPLAADPIYGGGGEIHLSALKPGYRPNLRRAERPILARVALHAWRITIDDPGGRGAVTFEAPLAKDIRATLNQLRRLG